MAKVLVKGQWFEEVSSTALYESDFERLVQQHSEVLFPHYVAVPFKRLVSDGTSNAKADLALIHRTYRDWWVVEVEMAHHSLEGHVVPQVRTLSLGSYGAEHARHFCEQSSLLDEGQLLSMMKGVQPKVLVVVNSPRPQWRLALSPYGALLAVMEIFRSETNELIFRLNGETPAALDEAVSRCYLDRAVPRLLTVESPGILTVQSGERLKVAFQNGQSEWTRLDAADKVWLHPTGNNPLRPEQIYALARTESGSFILREV